MPLQPSQLPKFLQEATSSPKVGDERISAEASIKVGEFVCCAATQIFDAEVLEIGDADLTVETADGAKHKLEKKYLGKDEVASFRGPWLAVEDLKKGKEVEFKWGDTDLSRVRGKIEGQTNSEVCVRPMINNSACRSELWIPREDIYFLYVMVFSASSLKNTDSGINNKSDPYIKIHLTKGGSKPDASADDLGGIGHDFHVTHYKSDDLNPTWNMDFRFLSVNDVEAVTFTVWDKDIGIIKSDDFLGRAELTKEKWEAGKDEVLELPLLDMEQKPMFGDEQKESKLKIRVKMFGPKDSQQDLAPSCALGCWSW